MLQRSQDVISLVGLTKMGQLQTSLSTLFTPLPVIWLRARTYSRQAYAIPSHATRKSELGA